jgi:hypothetical protein
VFFTRVIRLTQVFSGLIYHGLRWFQRCLPARFDALLPAQSVGSGARSLTASKGGLPESGYKGSALSEITQDKYQPIR